MQVRIELNGHLPVYVQLKEQLKFLILNGELEPGTKLPTIRQLAGYLGINRNTVQRAYQELERGGLVECRRGRGCLVVEDVGATAQSVSPELLEVIDRAIQEASELGVRPDDLATFLYARAQQRPGQPITRRLVFVECQTAIAQAIAHTIQERLGVNVIPVLLEDLRQPTPEVEEQLRQAHVVATTFFHIQELRRMLAKTSKEVVALAVKPHLENLIQIAGIPHGTPVGLVCLSQGCALELQRTLESAGIKGMDVTLGGVDDLDELGEMLPQQPVVIASDFVAEQVQPLLKPGQKLIALNYTALDEGAISLLRSIVSEEALSYDMRAPCVNEP
jgi:GntR family transcriptional regulator